MIASLLLAVGALGSLNATVVDVGPGLCVVVDLPNAGLLVYDAGHWNGDRCAATVGAQPGNQPIELLVLSHMDSDHLGDVPRIIEDNVVRRILHTGYERIPDSNGNLPATYTNALDAIRTSGAEVINLREEEVLPGATWSIGDAFVTFVAGWGDAPFAWGMHGSGHRSERRNAVSIVLRLVYAGRSILLTGDTYGRERGAQDDACEAAEAAMALRADAVPLRSDVIVAPHHGADNASSACFLERVRPTWVVFSAGTAYEHPRQAAAERYLAQGVRRSRIFRTDLGDNEGSPEWSEGASAQGDAPGDDDVRISIYSQGRVRVRYASPTQ